MWAVIKHKILKVLTVIVFLIHCTKCLGQIYAKIFHSNSLIVMSCIAAHSFINYFKILFKKNKKTFLQF